LAVTKILVTPDLPNLGVGQSIGGPGTNSNLNQPAFDIATISPNGPNPAQALDGPNPNGVNTILRFPSDTPPYYMMLPINKYSRSSWAAVGVLTEEARIILPLPQQMIDNHNIRYAIEDIGITGGIGFDGITGNKAQAAADAVQAAAAAALSGAAGQLGNLGAGAKKVFNGALGASGFAVNDFMTVMLKGPDYKKRDFIWRFSPKSAQETSDLRRIIQLINNSMAPSFSGALGSAFFTWPKLWKPEFVYNGRPDLLSLQTFKMKASVLTDASFNYTPNGNFSPFARTKAPTSVEMRLAFLELEFWLAGDFNDNGVRSANATPQIFNFNFNGVGTPAVAP
jgi:hypothetical protein